MVHGDLDDKALRPANLSGRNIDQSVDPHASDFHLDPAARDGHPARPNVRHLNR